MIIGALLMPTISSPSAMSASRSKSVPPYSIVLADYLDSEPLTDYLTYPAQYSAIESEGVPAVCWPRSAGTRQLRVVFQSPIAVAHDAALSVSNGQFENINIERWTLGVQASPTTLHFEPNGQAEATLTISGLPNLVETGDMTIPFQLTSSYTGLAGSMQQWAYLTEASPIGIQRPVWTDVLNDACLWAIDQAGVADCSAETTFGLFWTGVFVYDPNLPYYTRVPKLGLSSADYTFRLKPLFVHRYTPGYFINGDCQDVSNYLQIAWRALGIGGQCVQNFSDCLPIGFWTNPLCGTGSDAAKVESYVSFPFNFHQSTTGIGGTYDAAAAQWKDLAGANYANPPMAWPMAGYWQTPRVGAPAGQTHFWGVANRYADYNNPEGEAVGRIAIATNLVGYTEEP